MRFAKIAGIAGALALCAVNPVSAAPSFDEPTEWSLLAAGERDAILTLTTLNETTNNNGTDWYYGPDEGDSMGFVKEGFCIDQDTADGADEWMYCDDVIGFNQESAQTRLSWHTSSGSIEDGWRVGTIVDLADSNADTRRAIYTASTRPAFYPYGPMTGITPAELEGWTLCWIDDYSTTVSLETVWSVCDGDYLLYAAYHPDYEWIGEIPTGVNPNEEAAGTRLADTGIEIAVPVAIASASVSIAALMIRRRRIS